MEKQKTDVVKNCKTHSKSTFSSNDIFKIDRKEVIKAIDRIVRRTMQMDMDWNWPCGVAFYGIFRAYGLTGDRDYIHRKYVARAYKGIMKNISDDGTILNLSAGTAVMASKQDYRLIPKKRIQGWGQGLALAFLCALADFLAQNNEK